MTTEEKEKLTTLMMEALHIDIRNLKIENAHKAREIERLQQKVDELTNLHRAKQRYPELENLDSSEVN